MLRVKSKRATKAKTKSQVLCKEELMMSEDILRVESRFLRKKLAVGFEKNFTT
jgi:hypothetical protein